MLFDAQIWVTHDEYEYDPDSWLMGTDDDFVPSEYSTTMYQHESHHGLSWNDVLHLYDSWANTPGDHTIDITPCAA